MGFGLLVTLRWKTFLLFVHLGIHGENDLFWGLNIHL